jgi:hypothetical protein
LKIKIVGSVEVLYCALFGGGVSSAHGTSHIWHGS